MSRVLWETTFLKKCKGLYTFFTLLALQLYKDLAFLESAPGRQAIIDLHVRGVISFVNAYSK